MDTVKTVTKKADVMIAVPVTVPVTVTVTVTVTMAVDGKSLALAAGTVPYKKCARFFAFLHGMEAHSASAVRCSGSPLITDGVKC